MRLFYIFLFAFFALLLFVFLYPAFGSWSNKNVANYYINNAMNETESPNAVSAIVWDFRGFDTLGEETVLLTAGLGIIIIIYKEVKNGRNSKNNK